MHIQWFEDKINFAIPPTQANLDRLNRYAKIYAEHDMSAESLACVLCRLVVECKVRGSSVYGALSAYTGESIKIYYLPDLPLPAIEYQDLAAILAQPEDWQPELSSLGHDLCAVFPLAKRLSINPEHLLFVAIVAAELLMANQLDYAQSDDTIVPLQLDINQIEVVFGL